MMNLSDFSKPQTIVHTWDINAQYDWHVKPKDLLYDFRLFHQDFDNWTQLQIANEIENTPVHSHGDKSVTSNN